jgi:hypothetical protein
MHADKHDEPMDLSRAARMASWGLLLNGPINHVFYQVLDRLVPLQGALGIATKVVIDQAVHTPPLTVLFFSYEGCLSGKSVSDAYDTAVRKLWPTLCANWSFWTVVHVCTFSMVPLSYRVQWVNCANFFWSGYLSLQAHTPLEVNEAASRKQAGLEAFNLAHLEPGALSLSWMQPNMS